VIIKTVARELNQRGVGCGFRPSKSDLIDWKQRQRIAVQHNLYYLAHMERPAFPLTTFVRSITSRCMADDILIDCGGDYENAAVRSVLEEYLLPDVLSAFNGRLALLSTTSVDGVRLPRSFCRDRDVIVLSERIMPSSGDEEFHPDYRYFIFVVLHEVAHACRDHLSPSLDGLSAAEAAAQERETEELALKWFNDHASTTLFQPPLTVAEVEELRENARSRRVST
jgi:hypothetical protein